MTNEEIKKDILLCIEESEKSISRLKIKCDSQAVLLISLNNITLRYLLRILENIK